MLSLLLIALLASVEARRCNVIPGGYSATGCFLKPDMQTYCPKMVARPAWYRNMAEEGRAILDKRVEETMADIRATGTGCCLRPMADQPAKTYAVYCARRGSSRPHWNAGGSGSETRPRSESGSTSNSNSGSSSGSDSAAVPGEDLEGWPRKCSGAGGMSVDTIKRFVGREAGKQITLGKGKYVQRTRHCNALLGCQKWTVGEWTSRNSALDWRTKRPLRTTTPQLILDVVNEGPRLYLQAPYVRERPDRRCSAAQPVYVPGDKTLSFPDVKVGYLDSSGGFGCRSNGFSTDGGNTMKNPITGKITNTCAALFSEVYKFDTDNGYTETQWAFYTSF